MSSSDSDDADPFSFTKKSFKSKKAAKSISSDDSSSDDDSDSDGGRHRGSRIRKSSSLLKRRRRKYSDSSSSDDSDSSSDSCTVEAAPQARKMGGNSAAAECLEILDSDDEDENCPLPQYNTNIRSRQSTTAGASSMKALQKSQMAKAALKKAQEIPTVEEINLEREDEDMDCNVDDDDICVVEESCVASTTTTQPQLKIDVRTSTTKESFKLRASDTFQTLFTAFRTKHQLPSTTILKVTFDGQRVGAMQTPLSLDMEDGDLMDATVTDLRGKPVALSSNGQAAATASSMVVIRTLMPNRDSNLFKIKCSDQFVKLHLALCTQRKLHPTSHVKLAYQGEDVALHSTPSSVGMIGGNVESSPILLSVRVLGGTGVVVPPLSSATAKSGTSSGKKIMLKLRINGKDANVQDMRVCEMDAFSVITKQFCTKNSFAEDIVTFTLDGEKLGPGATPKGEDLEGGEIIDVLVKEPPKPVTIHQSPSIVRIVTRSSASPDNFANAFISIYTVRNLAKTRPKMFTVNKSDAIKKMKQDYMKYYKPKGCKNVKFYFGDKVLQETSTFSSLNVQDKNKIFAMENGRQYKASN